MDSLRRWSALVAWFGARETEVRLAIRMAVAGTLTFAIAILLGLQQGYWAVFTAVIVMQASLGGSVKATVDRLIGTLGGALYGGAIALIVANQGAAAVGLGVAAALLPLGFVAGIDARFRVAPVTAVIVLVSPFGQEGIDPLWFTVDRIFEIALGSVVALAVSLVVLPGRAHALLSTATAKYLAIAADFFAVILGGFDAPVDAAELRRLQMASRRAVTAVETVADEASRERNAHLAGGPDPEPVARTSLRVRSDIIMLARALTVLPPEPILSRLRPHVAAIAAEGRAALRALGSAYAANAMPPSLGPLDAALKSYDTEIAAIRADRALSAHPDDTAERVFALGFALGQFRKDLGDLADRAAEFARAPDGETA